jgi:hypothetical protein
MEIPGPKKNEIIAKIATSRRTSKMENTKYDKYLFIKYHLRDHKINGNAIYYG